MRKRFVHFISAVAATFVISAGALADSWSSQVITTLKETRSTNDMQSVMVTVKQDPATEDGFEAACIALQLSMLMQKSGADVTMFLSLGGTRIADQALLERDKRMCMTSSGEAPLLGLVNGFISLGGDVDRIMICPLCWTSRYGSEQEALDNMVHGAFIGTAETMGAAFLGADKMLDF